MNATSAVSDLMKVSAPRSCGAERLRSASRTGAAWRRSATALALRCVAALAGQGCIAKVAYEPADLRAAILRRAPELPPEAVVVPYEVDPQHVEIARRLTEPYMNPEDQVRALVEGMFSGAGFALGYAAVVTTTAKETLATRKGNCLALASVFVGLARALGMKAFYLDASARVSETSQLAPGIFVNTGHITAYVELSKKDRWYLDFDKSLAGVPHDFRVMDDMEATAHFYNNRGYERIDAALVQDQPADWAAASQDFAIAAHLLPHFGRAWNNLGIAHARLGQLAEAEAAYREAIDADSNSAAAYNNLGGLYLSEGRAKEALEVIREAVRLDPLGANTLFNLGRAQIANGDEKGGHATLERAAKLRDSNAERMLRKLDLYEHRGETPAPK